MGRAVEGVGGGLGGGVVPECYVCGWSGLGVRCHFILIDFSKRYMVTLRCPTSPLLVLVRYHVTCQPRNALKSYIFVTTRNIMRVVAASGHCSLAIDTWRSMIEIEEEKQWTLSITASTSPRQALGFKLRINNIDEPLISLHDKLRYLVPLEMGLFYD